MFPIKRYLSKIAVKVRLTKLRLENRHASLNFKSIPNIDRMANVEVGDNSILNIGTAFTMRRNSIIAVRDKAQLHIGDRVFLNRNTIITSRKYIYIGDNVTIGPNVCIYDHDHLFKELSLQNGGGYLLGSVRIMNNAWIGANVVILKGVTIGEGAVIGSGSIITKDVPAGITLIQKRANTYIPHS